MDKSGQPATRGAFTVADDLSLRDLRVALALGWRDYLAHARFGFFFAAFYVAGGFAIMFGLMSVGRGWWMIPVMAGFPLFAPFSAVGLYAVSRDREQGAIPRWRSVLGALKGHGDDQLLTMGGIIFVAFSFWMILAHGVFAIFMGESGIGIDGSGLTLTIDAFAMLLVGSAVGGLFALGLFAITVVSLPMLVDHEIDFITAIIASLSTFRNNRRVMIGWAFLIAIALIVALLPLFLGLFFVLPVLGHATWHLYRRAVQGIDNPATGA